MSVQIPNFCAKLRFLPASCIMKWCKSPYLAFSNTRTGMIPPFLEVYSASLEIFSSSQDMTSQHIPSRLIVLGCSRIDLRPRIEISAIKQGNSRLSKSSYSKHSSKTGRLKAKLNCRFADASRISAVAPWPMRSSAGCQVMGRKSILSL